MKNILFTLALLISFSSFGQIKSFNDIKNINSIQEFHRVCIENGYTFIAKEGYISYGVGLNKDKSKATDWATYYDGIYSTNEWLFEEHGVEWKRDNGGSYYDKIFEEVKKQCSFFEIQKEGGDNMACYSCPNSKYKGKICFYIEAQYNTGTIKHSITTE